MNAKTFDTASLLSATRVKSSSQDTGGPSSGSTLTAACINVPSTSSALAYAGRLRVFTNPDDHPDQDDDSHHHHPHLHPHSDDENEDDNVSLKISVSSFRHDIEHNIESSPILNLRDICERAKSQHGADFSSRRRTSHSENGEADEAGNYTCHICQFVTTSREEYNDHVNGHFEFRCPKCPFVTKQEEEHREHLKVEHQTTPEDIENEQGVRVPKVNAQGKLKTFKCKQCQFVSVTKEEFWQHTRTHIKPEKMLTCPKCPFVTEYKHHLDYHLRNHFGSKPFKCPSCSYSCVNKSMLNSHMKSHTTIYQYRCSDCNYATKYCHSLKLHLRKYLHKPAMVLNPDGTPNPLPIIDVYGTRRGPKIKKDESTNGLLTALHQNSSNLSGGIGSTADSESETTMRKCDLCEFHTASEEVFTNHMSLHGDVRQSDDEGPFESRESRSPPLSVASEPSPSHFLPLARDMRLLNATDSPATVSNPHLHHPRPHPHPEIPTMPPADWDLSQFSALSKAGSLLPRLYFENMLSNLRRTNPLLDLNLSLPTSRASESDAEQLEHASNLEDPSFKRRRKGKATKIERVQQQQQQHQQQDSSSCASEAALSTSDDGPDRANCNFCDLSFGDSRMFEIHMKFHASAENPFTCGLCGEECGNKVLFFVHTASAQHENIGRNFDSF